MASAKSLNIFDSDVAEHHDKRTSSLGCPQWKSAYGMSGRIAIQFK